MTTTEEIARPEAAQSRAANEAKGEMKTLKLAACAVFAWVLAIETLGLLYDFGHVPLSWLLPPFILTIGACSVALRLCLKATPGSDTETHPGWVIVLLSIFGVIQVWIAVEVARYLLAG